LASIPQTTRGMLENLLSLVNVDREPYSALIAIPPDCIVGVELSEI